MHSVCGRHAQVAVMLPAYFKCLTSAMVAAALSATRHIARRKRQPPIKEREWPEKACSMEVSYGPS